MTVEDEEKEVMNKNTSQQKIFVPYTKQKPETPETLFKYRTLNKHCISDILSGCFYSSKAKLFNDPFDPYIHIKNSKKLKLELIEIVNRNYEKNSEIIKAKNETIMKITEKQVTQLFKNSVFIYCLSNVDITRNIMWAHYADNHKGICIEYKMKDYLPTVKYPRVKTQENYFEKVKYIDKNIDATKIITNFYEFINSKVKDEIARVNYESLYLLKALMWKYEKEYRFIYYHNDKKEFKLIRHKLNAPKIKAIYCGVNISEKDRKILYNVIDALRNKPISFNYDSKDDVYRTTKVEIYKMKIDYKNSVLKKIEIQLKDLLKPNEDYEKL